MSCVLSAALPKPEGVTGAQEEGQPCRSHGHGRTLVRNGARAAMSWEGRQDLSLLLPSDPSGTSHWLNTVGVQP